MSHWDGGIGCSVSSGKTKKPAFGAWAGGSSSVSADSAESSESTEASPSGSVTSISGSGSAASETPSSPVNIESTGPSPSSALDENAGSWSSMGVEVGCGPASAISRSIFPPHESQNRASSRFSLPQVGQLAMASLPRFLLADDRRRLQEILLGGLAELKPAPGDRRLGVPHRRHDLIQGGVRSHRGRGAGIRREGLHNRLRLLHRRRLPRLHRPLHEAAGPRPPQSRARVRG